MIHYMNALSLSERLREAMQGNGEDLKFAVLESNLAEYANNCATWHWHEYAELAYVVSGDIECCTQNQAFHLKPGEGYYINGNMLHLHRMDPGCSEARFRVIQLDTRLFSDSGIIAQRYVRPIERCPGMEALRFTSDQASHRVILEDLVFISRLAEAEPTGYELGIVQRLFHIWEALYEMALPMLGETTTVQDDDTGRLKAMLGFIHTHFAESITVSDIAEAANISEREAFRAFREGIGSTPTGYLMRQRVNHGVRMLRESAVSVTEIAMASGFSTPSYFCKVFHDMTGMSPRDFRKNLNNLQ